MREYVEIFIDGSCQGNPGPGGYGIILRYKKTKNKEYEKIFYGGYHLTTNNRMELLAAIIALETLKNPCNITVNTDSQYVYQGITQWIHNWKKLNWKTSAKQIVKNIDLWHRLDFAIYSHILNWKWIKGHTGHLENERCNKLARIAASYPTLEDIGYKY